MKKMIKRIGAIALSCMTIFCATGCVKTEALFIEDGDFIYYNLKNTSIKEDCYAIVGTTEQGLKENIYMPAYFRGKEVKYTSYVEYGIAGGVDGWGMEVGNCKKLYFNYCHESTLPYYIGSVEYAFFAKTAEDYCDTAWAITGITQSGMSYVNTLLYENIKKYIAKYPQITDKREINDYIFIRTKERNNRTYINKIVIANVSFLFNYENSPNNDYFFINDFERGGLIKNAPYDPIRKGYIFGGWYKEAECVNKWNFAMDKLPEAEYDENGYVIDFVETKLYAKWIKQ